MPNDDTHVLLYLLARKTSIRYKPPRLIGPLHADGRCKICMAGRPSYISNPFAIASPPHLEWLKVVDTVFGCLYYKFDMSTRGCPQ